MKVGDLMYCTFGPKGFATLLRVHDYDANFWSILLNSHVTLMHKDHLVAL